MMPSQNDLDVWADRLHTALETSTPIDPPSETIANFRVADAYAIQRRNLARAEARGAVLVGHKIGLTSAPMQKLLGVDEPDYGYVLDTMVLPNNASVPARSLCAPRVEPEIAFRLHRPLRGPGVTIEDVLDATDALAVALEIVDSRIVDWRITLSDTIADNASSGAVVLGPWIPISESPDLVTAHADLLVNGELTGSGTGAAVLGHPAAAVAWLANALADFDTALERGQFVMSGSMTSAAFVYAGDHAAVDIDGLGSIRIEFI